MPIKISVIIPIYNKNNEDLKHCIDSVIEQNFDNIEILLIDDGSTRENALLCDEYDKKNDIVHVFHNKNSGVSVARNIGIKNASGEYIMFLDADDWIEPNCLSKLYKIAKKGYDIVYFDYYKNYNNKIELVQVGNVENDIYRMPIIGSSCIKLYSKKVIEKNLFSPRLRNGEDVEFNFRVFKNIVNSYYFAKPLYHYYIQSDSAVRNFKDDMVIQYQNTLNQIESEIDFNNAKEISAFYSFTAISFIMLCINYFFNNENKQSYSSKKKEIKNILSLNPYSYMLNNMNLIQIPFSRKIVIFFAKYKFYFGIYLISLLKNSMIKKRNFKK